MRGLLVLNIPELLFDFLQLFFLSINVLLK